MQLLTDETRIRRRKGFASQAKTCRIDPIRLVLWFVLPLVLIMVMLSTTINQENETDNSKHYLISPEALRSRSQRILHQQRQTKRSTFGSRIGGQYQKPKKGIPGVKDVLSHNGDISDTISKAKAFEPSLLLHRHAIPNTLIFTHSINLLETDNPIDEDVALKANVLNTIKLHPGAQVLFLTDGDCIASIARVLGSDSPLLRFFRMESHGMYKADICRGAALYEHGGLYFDVDLQARMPLWSVVKPTSTFVVPFVHKASKYPGNFFQAFIGTVPKNPIMKRYLELFIDFYEGKIDLQGPIGVLLLRKAHDEVVGTSKHPKTTDQKTQYFMEILYDKKMFPKVPPPTWGVRRACHFVVVANTQPPYVVPFYSRVSGSRMCGGSETKTAAGR